MNTTETQISNAIKQIKENVAETAKIKTETGFLKEILNALRG